MINTEIFISVFVRSKHRLPHDGAPEKEAANDEQTLSDQNHSPAVSVKCLLGRNGLFMVSRLAVVDKGYYRFLCYS